MLPKQQTIKFWFQGILGVNVYRILLFSLFFWHFKNVNKQTT
jgi:hypothetical protein